MAYVIYDDYDTKEVSKKHYEKIIKMHQAVQTFFLRCDDFDLNKRYSVLDIEVKLKGIDVLTIIDWIYKDREQGMGNSTLRYPFYYNNTNDIIGWLGVRGFNTITE